MRRWVERYRQAGSAAAIVAVFLVAVAVGHRLTGTYAGAPIEGAKPAGHARWSYRQLQGRGVPTGHVDGTVGEYLPDLKDKGFTGLKMLPRSGESKTNLHTQSTARVIYGRRGLAPEIDDVYFYSPNDWLGDGCLRAGSAQPPTADGRRLFTHSWIAFEVPVAENVLRRIDYLIDHDDVVMVVGVNNGHGEAVPPMLASAYNVIAVGVVSGNSSGGYTLFEGGGRCKPEVVARRGTTSMATPEVASVAARLLEAADRMREHAPNAGRSEVIKAVLLAGAGKPRGWSPAPGKPLDEHLGAGLARMSYSYAILQGGPVEPGASGVPSYGWSFEPVGPGVTRGYELRLNRPTGEASIVLAWNRRVYGKITKDLLTDAEKWLDVPRLADFDLRLTAIDDAGGGERVVAQSTSRIDNVEHIYLPQLAAGRYRLDVVRRDGVKEDWDYALAWRVERGAAGKR